MGCLGPEYTLICYFSNGIDLKKRLLFITRKKKSIKDYSALKR